MTPANKQYREVVKFISGIVTVILMVLISSCQKIVNIDLNSASPKFVIEGVITDSVGPFHVTLTK